MINYFPVIVILVLTTIVTARVTPRNKFETGLLKVIEKCRDGDVESLPLAFPSLKPLKIPAVKINTDEYSISVSELRVKGLENLSVERLSSSPSDLSMSIEISVPTLAIRADRYHLQAKALWFFNVIDDKGIFKSNINNLMARAKVQFGVDGTDTIINSLNLDYSADDIQVQLSGSSQWLNDIVNEKISDMMSDYEMNKKLQDVIIDLASGYLQGHTPEKFIEIISTL